jgi:hypothetical protein
MEWEDVTYAGSIEIGDIEGGTGGLFEIFNGINTSPYGPNGTGPENIFDITQSWVETIPSLLGEISTIHDSQEEFYDGEFSGSVILVTTQSLNQPYVIENVALNYKHVYYFATGFNEQNIFQSNFLNQKTSPQPGEMLFLCIVPGSKPFFTNNAITNIYTVTHIKISKQDCNNVDSTIPLGQLSQLLIQIPSFDPLDPNSLPQIIPYNINGIQEYSDYYLYETSYNPWIITQQIGGIADPNKDQQLFDYTISSSKSIPQVLSSSTLVIDNWDISPIGTNLPHYGTSYFNSSSGYLTLENTPNTPIQISASITTDGNVVGSGKFDIIINGEAIASTTYSTNGFGVTTTLNAIYYGIQEDIVNLKATRPGTGGTVTLVSASLVTTQLRNQFILNTFYSSPLNSSCSFALVEPYISVPNFYNSDQNALLNDVFENRSSTVYQDIDYNTGILTPTNFNLLLSGSAIKATVQDSNYTTARHIIPRYEGSKSTSQFLNKWTPPNTIPGFSDQGTYGKSPTVESLKNYVAYCDFIGGWPPEKMNASGAHILYLIKDDGTVVIPNTSENSLNINKGTFESGERVSIESKTTSTSGDTNFRNIIRGGTRIEPILYTQIGHTPAQWTSSINFEDIVLGEGGAIGNYQSLFTTTTTTGIITLNTPTKVLFTNTITGSAYLFNNSYQVSSSAVLDGVSLSISSTVNFQFIKASSGTANFIVQLFIYKNNSPILDNSGQPISWIDYYNTNSTIFNGSISIDYFVPNEILTANDEYSVYVKWINNPTLGNFTLQPNSILDVQQIPIPTTPINTSGINTVWGWPNPTIYPNVITSSISLLVSFYGNPNVKMKDISGSGFNPISLPWSIKYGDEFRFEGREDFVYQVSKIFPPSDNSPERITQTGSLEVHFNLPLPVSASSPIFNLNHFLIRRYVDDASLILLEGFKPIGSQGPFLVKPEYCSPELNKNIDQFILDLTQKGLL